MTRTLLPTATYFDNVETGDRRDTSRYLVQVLISLGLIAALVSAVSFQLALREQLKPSEMFSGKIVKSQTYYVAFTIQAALLSLAGIISFISTDFRSIQRGYLSKFLLLMGAALLMTARGYSIPDLFSSKIIDWTGPFPFFISLLVFAGAKRANWLFLGRVFVILAVLLSGFTLVGVAGLQSFTREEGVVSLGGTLNALYWPASWLVLKRYPPRSLASRLRFVPIFIYGMGSLFTQTRLNFIMLAALIAAYAYLQYRRGVRQVLGWTAAVSLVVWIGLFVSIFLDSTRGFERLQDVTNAFSSRLDEDTRSGQVKDFANDVTARDLLIGRGSFATWNWGGTEYGGGTDIGYLSLLFYGGVPLLLTYFLTHIAPCVAPLRKSRDSLQLTAAAIVLLWGVRMFSSSYPGRELDYYPILFCVGACISKVAAFPKRYPTL